MTDLLDLLSESTRPTPLAERLRPKTLDAFLGQEAVLGPGTPLRQLYENHKIVSLLFWGPPGIGKTTLARLLAQNSQARFVQLSAVSSGIADLRKVVEEAKQTLRLSQQPTVLFIDEIHRYNKTQQDALLPHVEDGTLTLIGATTENPSFQVNPALLSRMLLVRLESLDSRMIGRMIERGVSCLGNVSLSAEAADFIIQYANGDGRSALNLLDTAAVCAPVEAGKHHISVSLLEQLAQQGRLNYDKDGDAHYDHASAFQKSLRGSDENAALYWLAKMIACGEDPRFVARRLVVTASEDVGNADPMALLIAVAAYDTVERIGLPEARIALAQAVIYVARAPKSNETVCAIDAAMHDILHGGKNFAVPMHLRDSHYRDAKRYGHGVGYHYSHDDPARPQSFLPPELAGVQYTQASD